MRTRNSIALLALCGLTTVMANAGVAASTSPEETIRQTSVKVIEILADKALTLEQKKTSLDGYLDTCCDFQTISKLVMAKNWRSLKPAEQTEFMDLFRKYLVTTYGDSIESYSGETVDVLSGRKEARDDYTVMTKIARGSAQADILVDYRMRKVSNGEWKIIDVIAEGISLVSNLRSQFQEVVSQGGTDLLLRKLREKTLAPPPDRAAATADS
jgi:phospholipid transport system substrate-binding protein